MKNKRKDFKKFTSRASVSKRDKKAAARAELMRAVAETNVGFNGAKIRFSEDGGYSARQRTPGGAPIRAVGRFSSTPSGYGFVATDGEERDVFIPSQHTNGALDGDTVEISYTKFYSRAGELKTEGRVLRIVKEERRTVIGTVLTESTYIHKRRLVRPYVVADDGRFSERVYLSAADGVREGDKVEVRLKRSSMRFGYLEGELISNFGRYDSKEANYLAILREHEIETEFSDAELCAAEQSAKRPISAEGRTVRTETIFTMDGADAKDLDDAVSLVRLPGGKWRLGVHIADVSEYVTEKTALDRLAMARGTSVYFTDKVVPMLPPALSNDACSLNAGEDKYALSAIITLSESGEIIKTKIERSIIRSRVRGVYSEINEYLSGRATPDIKKKYAPVKSSLQRMTELHGVLLKRSEERGAIELDAPEAKIILDENGAVTDIIKRERGLSERIIEQFMLTANEAVATLLSERGIPAVYRVHAAPPDEKLDAFAEYARGLGLSTREILKKNAGPKDFSRLLDAAREKGLGEQISHNMLRAMSKAVYSDVRSAHFGLGIEYYCHFTSPIRRLSDLATHRMIKRVLLDGAPEQKYAAYAKRAAAAATEAELRAMSAERRIENLYKVLYMSDRIGEELEAAVSSVTKFGFFVTLENTCEGLVPISELPGVPVFDEKHLTITACGKTYKTADRLTVRLVEADISTGKLRFEPV